MEKEREGGRKGDRDLSLRTRVAEEKEREKERDRAGRRWSRSTF